MFHSKLNFTIFISFLFFLEWRMRQSWTEEPRLSNISVMKRKWKVKTHCSPLSLALRDKRNVFSTHAICSPAQANVKPVISFTLQSISAELDIWDKHYPLRLTFQEDVSSSCLILSSSGCQLNPQKNASGDTHMNLLRHPHTSQNHFF